MNFKQLRRYVLWRDPLLRVLIIMGGSQFQHAQKVNFLFFFNNSILLAENGKV